MSENIGQSNADASTESQFISLCIAWSTLSPLEPPAVSNAIAGRIWRLGESMRKSTAGRASLESLARSHESPAVRLKASAVCLRWAPEMGVRSLEEIAADPERRYGLLPSLAFVILDMQRKGTLL